ncbi:MAG: agmatinase [Saprospiraceae bacterium]|jgi:agmatinase
MKTFAGIEPKYADKASAQIYLQSINYDGTSTWGKGAHLGWSAFLDAADNMELYDIETDSEVYKKGIHVLDEAPQFRSPEEMYEYTLKHTQSLLELNKFLTFFGGEHSISIGIIKAFYKKHSDLTVLQIDAHADLRPAYNGTPFNHACAVYDASRHTNLIQVGIRSMDISEKEHMNCNKTYFAHKIIDSDDSWMDRLVEQASGRVYITVDLDAFDSSIMPATGTPEPGGLDWRTITKLLKKVFQQHNVVGFDIVELAPIPDMNAPQYLAAKLYYKMLSYKFYNSNKQNLK